MKHINRRDFIKIGSFGATALSLEAAFGGIVPIVGMRGRNVSMFNSKFRKGIPTLCNLCSARCGIKGFLRYDTIVAIQGNPYHPNNQGKICARGIAGINQVYSPDRILYPMKRTGKRGENKWTKISWDEALKEIASRLQAINSQGRDREFVFHVDPYHYRGLVRRFSRAFGQPSVITSSPSQDANKEKAQQLMWGSRQEVVDAENTKYFLFFGSNPFETHAQFVNFNQRVMASKIKNHAKIVTIDPRLSNTAGRSDQWIPINPGTDAMMALAMANVIMQHGLYDAQFINRWTDVSVSQLKSYLAQYRIEEAAQITGVDAATIKQVALDFATTRPAVVVSGAGVSAHTNGFENERAVMMLNALVGNIDKIGGVCLPRTYDLTDYSPVSSDNIHGADFQFFEKVKNNQQKVDLFFSYLSNPTYEYPDTNVSKEVMRDEKLMPFTVTMDIVMSETAALSDIVLPAATSVESWDLESPPSFEMVPFVSLGQPVIVPRQEVRSLNSVFLELAKRLGGNFTRALNYENVFDYIKKSCAQIPALANVREFKKLRKQGIWYHSKAEAQFENYRTGGFKTKTGKFQLTNSAVGGRSLPKYQPVREKITLAKNELILIPYTVNVMREDLTHLKWLTEIHHSNKAWINAKTARKLKIAEDDYIQLESPVGKIIIQAHITQGVHPGIIAISKGLGHWEYGRVSQAKPFKSDDPDTNFIWWEKEGKGTHPNFVIPVTVDRSGGGQAWKDTIVKITKV